MEYTGVSMFETFSVHHLIPLLRGAGMTVMICVVTILIGLVIGIICGVVLTTDNKIIRAVVRAYVNVIRGIPLLTILFIVYYGIPILIRSVSISREFASIFGLSIYAGAYIAELVRGAIQSIPKGQSEAAQALGMTTIQRMIYVVMPQAVRLLIPPLVGFLIAMVKDSSLISIIGYIDLTRAGKIIGNLTMNPLLTFTFVALIYFIICYSLSRLAKYSEQKLRHNQGGSRI